MYRKLAGLEIETVTEKHEKSINTNYNAGAGPGRIWQTGSCKNC